MIDSKDTNKKVYDEKAAQKCK